MAVLIRPKRWATAPPPSTLVDPSHPLSNGLVGLWVPSNASARLVNRVDGRLAATLSTSQPVPSPAYGGSLGFTAGSSQAVTFSSVAADFDMAGNGAGTYLVQAEAQVGNNYFPLATPSGAQWLFGLGGVTGTLVFRWGGGSAGSFTTTKTFPTVIAAFAGSNVSTYCDGVLQTTFTQAPVASGGSLALGARSATFYTGRVGRAAVWNRPLTAAEVEWLQVEPYAMLRPQSPRQRYWTNPASSTVLASVSIPTAATASASPAITVTSAPTVTLTAAGSTSAAPTPSIAPVQSTVSLTTAATATSAPTLTVTPADQVGPDTTSTTTTAPAPSTTVAATISLPGVATATSAPTRTLPVTVDLHLVTAATATASPVITVTGVGPTVPDVKGWSRGGIGRAARISGSPARVAAMRGTPVRTGSSTGGLS